MTRILSAILLAALAIGCRVKDEDEDGYTGVMDCDPQDPSVYFNAPELCNGVDDDCDGLVDEEVEDAPTWYLDSDGDGYGDEFEPVQSCTQPPAYVEDATDCDDEDAAYHPGAPEDDCTDPNDYNCDGSVGYEDADGDGHAACEDCDDADPSVHPLAIEVCNGIDDDCDGVVDGADAIDANTYYADTDGDGFGDPASTTRACELPADGYVVNDDDCDDATASTYPGADETCNEVDDDCDGEADERAVDAPTWYQDVDADGYGNSRLSVESCTQPSGYVSDATDCDDLSATTYPGADETCDDEDDDCDGTVDNDPVDPHTWYADSDGDGYGDVDTSTAACDQPTGYVSDTTDCDDGDSGTYPGADEYCDEEDNDCDGDVDEDDAVDADTWYMDADDDGYGSDRFTTTACEQPTGYVDDDSDCDDSDDDIYPGATETCNEEDDDCDGDTDEDEATGQGEECAEASCYDILTTWSSAETGVYWIDPTGVDAYEVYCDMDEESGGWTLLSVHTNNDGTNWWPEDGAWVDTTPFGDSTDPSNNADAKSQAFVDMPMDEVMIVHYPSDVGVVTDTGCVDGDTFVSMFQTDAEYDSDCAHACSTATLASPWTGQYYQNSTLKFRCTDYEYYRNYDDGGYSWYQDQSMLTTLNNASYYRDYNFGLSAGEDNDWVDWDESTGDWGDDSDTTQVLVFGR